MTNLRRRNIDIDIDIDIERECGEGREHRACLIRRAVDAQFASVFSSGIPRSTGIFRAGHSRTGIR